MVTRRLLSSSQYKGLLRPRLPSFMNRIKNNGFPKNASSSDALPTRAQRTETYPSETPILCSPIGGIGSPLWSLATIHSSVTSISSFLHSSTVFPEAQTPGSSGTEAKYGSSSSITLYSALESAVSTYSENMSSNLITLKGFNAWGRPRHNQTAFCRRSAYPQDRACSPWTYRA